MKKIKYRYYFKTRTGLKVNMKSNNPGYARQELAKIYNVKQKDLKLVKREKLRWQ